MNKIKFLLFLVVLFFHINFYAQKQLDVYFDFNKSDINTTAAKTINTWISEGKDYKISKIYGFCDFKGDNSYNDSLALMRIKNVLDYLKESDIKIDYTIETRAFGEDFIQNKNQGKNRRVSIFYSDTVKEINDNSNQVIEILSKKLTDLNVGEELNLKNIFFHNNSARVVKKSETYLYELFCILKDNPNLKIEIQGHICCKSPNEPENISAARARFIYNYLVAKRIDRNRLAYKGYGVSRPIYTIPEKNQQEEDENRRVTIKVIEK